MLKRGFNVTFERVDRETLEIVDSGFLALDESLSDALREFRADAGPIEADSYPIGAEMPPRWLTVYPDGDSGYEDDYVESRSLHFPNNITTASALRIARLLDCYGA